MVDSPESKHTAGAQRALGLAELMNKVFANEHVPSNVDGHPGYRVEMTGPEVLSTEQKGAAGHLRIVPATPGDPSTGKGAPIQIATADPNLSQVELRTYDRLQALHAQRFPGEVLPIDSAAYDALRKKLEQFFERQGITTISSESRTSVTIPPRASRPPPPRPGRLPILVIVGVVLVLALVVFALQK